MTKNAILRALQGKFPLRMRRSGRNATCGFRYDPVIRSGMVENIFCNEIRAETRRLWDFEQLFSMYRRKKIVAVAYFRLNSDHAVRSFMPENLFLKYSLKRRDFVSILLVSNCPLP